MKINLSDPGRLLLLDNKGGRIVIESDAVVSQTERSPVANEAETIVEDDETTIIRIESIESLELKLNGHEGNIVLRSNLSHKPIVPRHTVSIGGMWRRFPLDG